MAMALLSAPPLSHQTSFFQRPYCPSFSSLTFFKYPSKPTIPLSTTSSSSTSTAEDEPSASPDIIPVQSEPVTVAVDQPPFRGCKACGREEMERGCNGEGRIQGGIATVPGFGWWPIKAYRPCPGFVASGGRYRRRGQSMDEVASGRIGRASPVGTNDEAESSKKKQGPRKFKR
ncbi:uncharacterized protein LOC110426946 [Herrania umbratica]|uniref:Uncharacterized protein LOC110426946 n=1 Tax=Herrania umbratica TaxID=108875 RepID=A0A6J1BFS2_9ROSI|nr:uncharacterized protein LOC110426946 [Herrania umbratica]